ncbi:MAG TPA: SRPBCC domain-containing protein [Gemmatimonadales bacterium]|nr:SRPBCC domain-containing protein [Gemmatimonadales bacterium]
MDKTAIETTRTFEMSLDIDAPSDAVWRALTEAEELVRWFPTGARVTPGEGGTMLWSWDKQWDWETRIDAWEPGRLLRLVQEDARPFDAQGRPLPAGKAEPARIAMEFTLETHRGKTRLRLVHSGFGHGAAWDDELEGITEGWQAELRSLRHYLQRHRGRDRTLRLAWLTTALPREAAWARLLGPGGFRVSPAVPEEGRAYEVVTPDGQRLSGTVELCLPGQTLAGTVRELDDGWFRLLTWAAPGGETGVWAGLATYARDDGRVEQFQARAQEALARLFPPDPATP